MTNTQSVAPLGVVLVGAGMIAKRHVVALSNARHRAQLLAVVSRNPSRATYLADHYAGPPPLFTSDIDAVAQMPDVHIAIVATPPSVRIELIGTLAQAGIHVLLEKPVARTFCEAEEVIQKCEQAGTLLGVLFQHRVRNSAQWARQKVDSGSLGSQGLIEIRVPLWRPQSYYDELERGTYHRDGGGVLITQAIHTIDLALSLTGPVTQVQAMTATTPLHQMEAEDFAMAGLHFASGAVGSLSASTATFPHGNETITIHCERGSLRLGAQVAEISWRDGRIERYPQDPQPGEQQSKQEKAIQSAPQSKEALHQTVIEDFFDAVENNRKPMVTGRMALVSHQLIEAIESSSRKGQAIKLEGSVL